MPLLPPLAADPEAIVRQNVAAQLLPLGVVLLQGDDTTTDDDKEGNSEGYEAVANTILPHLFRLLRDGDPDTRRCASDSLSNLCKPGRLRTAEVGAIIAEAAKLAAATEEEEEGKSTSSRLSPKRKKKKAKAAAASAAAANGGGNGAPPGPVELKVGATNLLAEISSHSLPSPSSSSSSSSANAASNANDNSAAAAVTPDMVSNEIVPPLLVLSTDAHFRVRRAAAQALPRLLAGSTAGDAAARILPALRKLAADDMYRVRKAVGECLVDMSRGMMLLADSAAAEPREGLMELRRTALISICAALLADPNKFVRRGMQQFLGPFLASFYPLGGSNDDGAGGGGGALQLLEGGGGGPGEEAARQRQPAALGASFFPHAAGMAGRLHPGSAAAEAAAAAGAASEEAERRRQAKEKEQLTEEEGLLRLLPPFLVASRSDAATLRGIVEHRSAHPPSPADLAAVRTHLLPPFVALADCATGDENLDAEMRVYCAYSLPGVVLLMGREGWSSTGDGDGDADVVAEGGRQQISLLRKCFLSLATGVRTAKSSAAWADASEEEASTNMLNPAPVPLPVKRCLASSFHTMCCILGRDIVSAPGDGPARPGILQVYEHYFLRDPDDTVRLNVMRTLPSLLSLLDKPGRARFLPTLHSIIVGDAVLGAPRKRSATNPQLLNWRQRDAVSQILPDLVLLYGPIEVRRYLWPILQLLLADKVNAVRDDVEFCIPTVLRSYAPENVAAAGDRSVNARTFSREACEEVVTYLKQSLLQNNGGSVSSRTNGSYARRQMYCRTCAALAIALRLGKSDDADRSIKTSPTDEVTSEGGRSRHPYESYTPSEYRHMHNLLEDVFLPDALNMREDRVSNVRLTLVDALKVMPQDILDKENVKTILTTLEDAARTWDAGFGFEEYGMEESVASSVSTRGRSTTNKGSTKAKAKERKPLTPTRRSKFDRSAGPKRHQEAAQDDDKKEKESRQDGATNQDGGDDDDDGNSLSSI